ncbi:2,3-dihydroxyphenylpropionate 1,2-dioxygenase [Rhodococcoides trifolii]|uniref:2,3-dihydroxyphenylpropionate 1,2-dioxygenase n=1 Tax=Rhodococcoides trifolii TaxID=908250 RepID=A0A917LIL8_9NOCA|nr:3-carboxyethylcatechol 2,3-dioxygenase [Rhodococcus trifolii]GGG27298.1 2,3-dihydroxyphenylpropionate 1,2-dioxygenase [Rhodococcus trifolii]
MATLQSGARLAGIALSHSPQMLADVEHTQGLKFRIAVEAAARAVQAYDPTLVVYFGPDHMRALAGIAPAFTAVEAATGYGDWNTASSRYDIPSELVRDYVQFTTDNGVEVALAPELKLDHGFGQSTTDLFGRLDAVPMLPVVVNCIDRPLATTSRVIQLGGITRRFLDTSTSPDDRVLVIGSGGLSHSPPSLIPGAHKLPEAERQALITDNMGKAIEAIRPDWDKNMLRLLADGDLDAISRMTHDDIQTAGTGAHEVRTWIAVAATVGEPLDTIGYETVSEWITGMGIAADRELGVEPAVASR